MAFKINHLHLKTPDPQKTAQWYVDNLDAKIVSDSAPDSYRLDLHGLPLNVTRFIDGQTHQQQYGIEHIAVDTDDMDGVLEKLKAAGSPIVEEWKGAVGRRVYFIGGPEGVLLEVIEMPK
tara:strand:+ start:191 stop:550 length:360 start_codon:yes stop_codon:yes gene_type:complete